MSIVQAVTLLVALVALLFSVRNARRVARLERYLEAESFNREKWYEDKKQAELAAYEESRENEHGWRRHFRNG